MHVLLALMALVLFLPSWAFAQVWPNEPAGSQTLFDCGFTHPTCNGQLQDPYNTANTLPSLPSANTLSVVTDTSAPVSPPSVLRSQGNAATGNGGTQLEYRAPFIINEVYVGLWWRTNPEFTGSSVNTNKLFTIRGGPNENGFFLLRSNPELDKVIHWTTQLTYNLDKCGGAPDIDVCYPNVTTTPIIPGTWYKLEVYMKASSCPTCKDGIWRWWVNGVLNGNYVNVAYGPRVDEWVWTETWDGGGSGKGFTTNPSHYIDHLHISVPNCGSGCGGGVTPNPDSPAGPPAAPAGLNAQKVTQ